ncbi:MAG: hypothetical protein IIZ06_03850, partial [Kiritimatiellae bacterium]|nr:hypothetical protein [Kiritimatiellia bacterium]
MRKAMVAAAVAAMIAAGAEAKTGARKQGPVTDDMLVHVKSTLDGTMQPCWFWAPEKAKDEAVPLVVGLHTWSCGYTMRSNYAPALEYA